MLAASSRSSVVTAHRVLDKASKCKQGLRVAKLVKVNTRIPDDLLAQLREVVRRDGAKMQTAFATALRMYLAKKRKK